MASQPAGLCSGLEFFEPISSGAVAEASEFLKKPSDHSLRHFISDSELQKLSPDMQSMAWHAINIKDHRVDKGRIYEAMTLSMPALIAGYHGRK